MKTLLTTTAVFEGLVGTLLAVMPATTVVLLTGAPLTGPPAFVTARLAGVALFSLALVCWLSRENAAAAKVVTAMLFFQLAAASVLMYGIFRLGLSGMLLFPPALIHIAFAAWCVMSLRNVAPK